MNKYWVRRLGGSWLEVSLESYGNMMYEFGFVAAVGEVYPTPTNFGSASNELQGRISDTKPADSE